METEIDGDMEYAARELPRLLAMYGSPWMPRTPPLRVSDHTLWGTPVVERAVERPGKVGIGRRGFKARLGTVDYEPQAPVRRW